MPSRDPLAGGPVSSAGRVGFGEAVCRRAHMWIGGAGTMAHGVFTGEGVFGEEADGSEKHQPKFQGLQVGG
jgi:hypothetical protein